MMIPYSCVLLGILSPGLDSSDNPPVPPSESVEIFLLIELASAIFPNQYSTQCFRIFSVNHLEFSENKKKDKRKNTYQDSYSLPAKVECYGSAELGSSPRQKNLVNILWQVVQNNCGG